MCSLSSVSAVSVKITLCDAVVVAIVTPVRGTSSVASKTETPPIVLAYREFPHRLNSRGSDPDPWQDACGIRDCLSSGFCLNGLYTTARNCSSRQLRGDSKVSLAYYLL